VFTANDLIPQVWEGRRENGNWIFYRNWELNGKKRRSRTFWTKDSDKGFTKIVEQLNDDGKTWRLHDKAEFEKENIKISSAREQTITLENDGWKIVGDLLIPKSESPVPAVILLNKANGDRKVYENLAKHLAEKGIASFRVDLRAHGESINKGKFGPPFDEKMRSLLVGSDRDVTNAFNYLKAKPEIDAKRIGFVGGSYSGEQMVVAARNSGEYGKAYVALSPGSFSDESIESIDEKQIPFFFIKSVVELPFFKELFLAIREKSKTAQILEVSGDKHATEILEEHPELVEIIAVWFKAKL
jgi:dienelactone hydrolase